MLNLLLFLHLHFYFYIFVLRSYCNAQLKIYIDNCAIENNKIIIIIIKLYPKQIGRAMLDTYFSNAFIIHQVKTKEITKVKEVWIPGFK